ncbi:MAG: hypothetical protein ABI347_08450 [Nitrososphaera sp.]|jgi:hypothetical protein
MKKYVIAGAIGVIAVVGILFAFAYNTPGPKTVQDSTSATTGNPVPQGTTAGAGQDNPGPNDGGATSDPNPKPIPSTIVAASIAVSPNPYTLATAPSLGNSNSTTITTTNNNISLNVGGDGFTPNQTIKFTLNNSTSLQTDPSPITSSGTGGFTSDKIILPANIEKGRHTITAIDESGKSASTTLEIK